MKALRIAPLMVLSLAACTTVDTTEHCILTRYGEVVNKQMSAGLNWTPFSKATCFKMVEHNYPGGTDKDGQPLAETMEAQTSDPITVLGEVALVYAYDPNTIYQVFMEKRSPDQVEIEITNSIRAGYRAAIGKFSVSELFQHREQFSDSVKAAIQRQIGHRARITNLFIRSITVPKVIEDARIAAAQQAQVLDKALKQQAIAEAGAKATVATAEGDATANRLRAQSYSSNPKLLDLEIAKAKAEGMAQVCSKSTTCIIGGSIADTWMK
jgi:regulator of protease activity HflC (stomatin/prohibitin superfamily)